MLIEKHAPEPWHTENEGKYVVDANGNDIANCDVANVTAPDPVNAQRICACVNACEGISTQTLEGLSSGTMHLTLMAGIQVLKGYKTVEMLMPDALVTNIIRVLNVHGLKATCNDETHWTGNEEQQAALIALHQTLCEYLPPLPEQA
jgi:hypothetical protein